MNEVNHALREGLVTTEMEVFVNYSRIGIGIGCQRADRYVFGTISAMFMSAYLKADINEVDIP